MKSVKYPQTRLILYVFLLFSTSQSVIGETSHSFSEYEHLNDDTDDRMMTFVNQTGHKMKFKIDGRGDRAVSPYTAERQDCHKDKSYDFTVDLVKTGFNKEVHAKITGECGKTYYLYYKDKKYQISSESSEGLISPTRNTPYVYKSDIFDVDMINSCETYSANTKTVLFAHGYNSNPEVWDTFASEAHKKGWRVLRTMVTKNASIKKRARMLNAYIMRVADKCVIPDGTLRVVGHSMGGLDLRYIIHYNLPAARKIEQVYTLATPHQGDNLSNLGSGDAIDDMKPAAMRKFNYWNPYCGEQQILKDHKLRSERFKVGDRQIYLYAYRFNCDGDDNKGDGIVGWKKQGYGNNYTSCDNLIQGKHSDSSPAKACKAKLETEQLPIIVNILADETHDESCKSTTGNIPRD